ncbi:MAG: lycopene cyclase family protein, partial [Prochlorococcaceae cyanobacterium]
MAPAPAAVDVAVVGAGLAGGLLALALRRHGLAVTLVAPAAAGDAALATALSYGGVPGRGGERMWRELERRHGPLGWHACGLKLHGGSPLLAGLVLPCGRVDARTLLAALPGAWARAGVVRLEATVEGLAPA